MKLSLATFPILMCLALASCVAEEAEHEGDEGIGETSEALGSREVVRGYRLPYAAGATRAIVQYPHGYRDQIWNAIDIGLPRGTEVLAMKEGTVSAVVDTNTDYAPGYVCNWASCNNATNYVIVQHADGQESSYLHLARGSVAALGIAPGTHVCRGQTIGVVGHNGYSYGPHVHVSVQSGGSAGPRSQSWSAMWSKPTKVIAFDEVGGEVKQGLSYTSNNTAACGAPVPPPPAATSPTGLSPANGADAGSSYVDLTWNAVAGATGYDVAIKSWNGTAFVAYYTYHPTGAAQRFWPQLRNRKYAWSVTARLAGGGTAVSGEATFDYH